MNENNTTPKIVYSCYYSVSRGGEQFVSDHVFSFQISGTLSVSINDKNYTFNPGDFRFSKRNELAKFVKHPPAGGEFKSISIRMDQETLRSISHEYGLTSEKKYDGEPIVQLNANPLFKTFIDSLLPYLSLKQEDDEALFSLKVRESVLLLLRAYPELKDILCDFTEPGKIDLEEFMQINYHFNVSLARFAYLSGRSLATFKRDFQKTFHTSPSKWLLHKRLQEAHHQIKEKGKKPSEVYLDVGFEDLSHFSFAFKKAYGEAPSRI